MNTNFQNNNQYRKGLQGRIFSQVNKPNTNQLPNQNLNLRINRVTSKQYKERQEKKFNNSPINLHNYNLTNSLYTKIPSPEIYQRYSQKLVTSSSSGQKISSNQNIKNQNKFNNYQVKQNAPLHVKINQNNNIHLEVHSPRYANNKDSQNCSVENEVQQYNPMNNLISSVISRQERRKISDYQQKQMSASSKYKEEENFDQNYAYSSSRFPLDSNKKLGMDISKAISTRAIKYELEKQYETQNNTIKKLQTEVESLKVSQHHWGDTKNKYQLDMQAKVRQIFDLERANKRLTEEVKNLKSYRTVETVQQVIIARLKQQILILNKKNIEKESDRSKLDRSEKKYGSKENSNDKHVELLNEEIKKEKQKSWRLEKEKQQYLIEKQFTKEDYERQISNAKTDINILNEEVMKHINTIRMKQKYISEMKRAYQQEIKKLNEKLSMNNEELNKIRYEIRLQIEGRERESYEKRLEEEIRRKMEEMKEGNLREIDERLKDKQNYYMEKLEEQKNYYLLELSYIKQINNTELLSSKLEEQKKGYEMELKREMENRDLVMKEQEVYFNELMKEKESYYLMKLEEEKKNVNYQLADKFRKNEEEYKGRLEEELRKLERKLVEYERQDDSKMNKYEVEIGSLKERNEREVKENERFKEEIKVRCKQIERIKQDSRGELEREKDKWIKLQCNRMEENIKYQLENKMKQKQIQLINKIKQKQILLENIIKQKQNQLINKIKLKQNQLVNNMKQKQIQLVNKLKNAQLMQNQNQFMRNNLINKQQQINQILSKKQYEFQQKIKISNQQFQNKFQQLLNKYNALQPQINSYKSEKLKLQQKIQQNAIQLKRTIDTINVWKMKAQSVTAVERQRDELKALVKQLQEGKGIKSQLQSRIDELTSQKQTLAKKLSQKEDQFMKEKSTYIKIRGYYDNDQQKGGILSKEILALESKIVEVETKLRTVLKKVELEEFKYKELFEKVSADALIYMQYIHRLQEESEQNYKKYLKLYKIFRTSKVKMEDEGEEVAQKMDNTILKEFVTKQIVNQFKKMIIPGFECKISQKLAQFEESIIKKSNRIYDVRQLIRKIKKMKGKAVEN